MKIRLAGLQNETIVNGPGVRLAIFFQGCSHRCPGCQNPETHDPRGGEEVTMESLLDFIDHCSGLDGITFTGGEPFEQAVSAAALAGRIVRRGANLALYSGYTFEALVKKSLSDQNVRFLLEAGRLLIDGPFIQEEQDISLPYRGSRNQRIIDLPRSLKAGSAIEWAAEISSGI